MTVKQLLAITFEDARAQLDILHAQASADPVKLTKVEVVEAVAALDIAMVMRTNSQGAAAQLFSAVAPFCAVRPDLIPHLLPYPIGALVNFVYDNADDILAWVKYYMGEGDGSPGATWLAQELPAARDLIQGIIDSELASAKAEWEAHETEHNGSVLVEVPDDLPEEGEW